jgi:hypothetical protein
VGFHWLIVHNVLSDYSGPFLVQQNSKICLATPLSCFCNWIRLVADVNTIGGVHDRFAWSCFLCCVGLYARGISVHIRCPEGVEKFLVATSTDALGSAAFFEAWAASSVLHLFLLQTSLKPSPCLVCHACVLAFRTLFVSLNNTVHVTYSVLNSVFFPKSLAAILSVFFCRADYCGPLLALLNWSWCVSPKILNVAQNIH